MKNSSCEKNKNVYYLSLSGYEQEAVLTFSLKQ